MKQAIWKFAIPFPGGTIVHNMPPGATFLHVDYQPHEPFPVQAWFSVDPDASSDDYEHRTFTLVPTGAPFDGFYFGTVVHNESATVWHLVELGR